MTDTNRENKSATVDKTTLPNRIKTLLKYLNQNLYGKEEAVRLALLSAVAGESIFFLGLPGTAKSMISRRIASAFSDFYEDGKFNTEKGGYFEYLMNEFSTPDEICGPVDLSALNEKPSRYTRETKGYLPSAKVAFLDEIWKSGPAILNTLLPIVNERIFHNGSEIEKVPLVSLAAASNELPEKNRGLDALWDRFILRVQVNPVSNEEDFFKVVDEDSNKELISTAELTAVLLSISDVKSWQAEIDKIELGSEAKNVITAIRKELVRRNNDTNHKGDETYYVSDRRWKRIVHLLKTSAFLNGRDSVDLMDCSLIEYCIWNTDKQQSETSEIIEQILKQNGISLNLDIDDIKDQIKDFHDYITKQFYTEEETPFGVKTSLMQDGCEAYELVQTVNLKICLPLPPGIRVRLTTYKDVAVKYISKTGNYYDDTKQQIGEQHRATSVNLDISSQKLNWIDSHNNQEYERQVDFSTTKGQGLIKNPAVFEHPDFLELRQQKSDTEWYQKILTNINNSLKEIDDFEAKQAEPFRQNQFVEQKFCEIILSAVKDSRKQIEDAKLKLEKERQRYAN
ncbi:AAA family ATPase [bacterium]|nr:AAA family ATPase [bacterium]